MRKTKFQLIVLVVLVGLIGVIVSEHQVLADWWRLRGYAPPSVVTQLANDDTMTSNAQHLFYVNRPVVEDGKAFTGKCPGSSEKTVVLGCYVGNDTGIYISKVTDKRLDGVEQVTAAHEMLHAAYRRLSSGERQDVDTMLMDYYQHDLVDQRIKDTIDAYKKSEPHDVVNEMHSIFGTEIAALPEPLENYYKQYFTDRSKVAAYTARYQGEFTSRRLQVAAYDTQLSQLKTQIDTHQAELKQQKATIDQQAAELNTDQTSGQIAAYNALVPEYNRGVNAYNAEVAQTRSLIDQYNTIIVERNAVVLEEQQLAGELSSNAVPLHD